MSRIQMKEGVDLKLVGEKLVDLANTHFAGGYEALKDKENDFLALFEGKCLAKVSEPTKFGTNEPAESGIIYQFHYDTTIFSDDKAHETRVVNVIVPDLQGKYEIGAIEQRLKTLEEGYSTSGTDSSVEDEISALHASINLNTVAQEAMGMVVILGCQ